MRTILSTVALTALLVAAAGPANAGWDEGVAAFKAKNYAKAVTEFQQLAQERPDCTACHQMLGQSFLALGKPQDAITALRKAYEANPNDNGVRLPLAQAYLEAKRYDDAVKLLQTIDGSTLPADKQQVFFQMPAAALAKSGRGEQAIEDLRRAAAAKPNDSDLQYAYGTACLAARDACAIPALEAAVRLDGADAEKRESLVKAHLLQGRQTSGAAKTKAYQRAAEVAQQLVSAKGTFENIMLLGEAQLGGKQYAAAASTFERAVKANAGDWLALYYLGQAQTQTGAFGEAERNLKAALAKAGSSQNETLIWKQLGYVYEKQKNYEEAKMAYRKVGDAASVARVEQNQQIAAENEQTEEYNEQIEELEEEKRRLEEQMRDLPPGI